MVPTPTACLSIDVVPSAIDSEFAVTIPAVTFETSIVGDPLNPVHYQLHHHENLKQ